MEIVGKISFYLEKVSGYIDRIFNLVGIILYSSMTALVFVGTVSRYALASSFPFTEELATMLMIVMGFLCATNPFKRGEHPKLIMVINIFPKQIQKVINVLIHIFCMYIILRLIPSSFSMIWTIGQGQRLATLDVSMVLFYIPMGLGFSMLLFEFINLTVKEIIKKRTSLVD